MPSDSLSFIGISRFRGYWNASTNTALSGGLLFTGSHANGGYANGLVGEPSGSGKISTGEYWQVNTAGSTNLEGNTGWQVDDWLVYTTGSRWARIDYVDTVSSIVVGSTDIKMLSKELLASSSNTQILFNSGSTAAGTMISGSKNLTYDYQAGIMRMTGSLFVSGTLVANEYKVNVHNETIVNISSTGSTSFGDSSDDTHKFTGLLELNDEHPKLLLRSNSANGDPQIIFRSGDGSTMANIRCAVTNNIMESFSINGSTGEDHLVVASDGKIGIGTTSPSELLHIKSSVTYKPEVLIENSNDDAIHSILRFYKSTTDEAAGDDVGAIFFTGKDAADSDADMAWILGAGTTVTAGAEEGVIHMGVASAGAAATSTLSLVGEGTANTTYAYFGDPASGGTTKVGIGIVAPATALHIYDEHPTITIQSSHANGDGGIKFKSLDGTQLVNFRCDATSNALNHFAISAGSGEDHLVVASGGNVGIGTTSPTSKLSVSGQTDLTGSVLPGADNAYDLGSSAHRWANIYTGDLHLKNDKGDWTIVEEEDYLEVVNNKTGKKYKMMLQEIED